MCIFYRDVDYGTFLGGIKQYCNLFKTNLYRNVFFFFFVLFFQLLLDKIIWPVMDSDDDEEWDVDSMCLITGFLRTFIETGVVCSY